MSIEAWIGLIGLVASLIGVPAMLVWKLTRVEKALSDKIVASAKEVNDRLDRAVRDFGETVAAVREKIREVELYIRDTYMRRDSFYEVNRVNQADMKAFFDRIENRLERMEGKIDTNARDAVKAAQTAAEPS